MANPAANLNAVRETMEVLFEISRILNTGLDMETLSICVRLCEQGINPEALSAVIKELRKATEALKPVGRKTDVYPDYLSLYNSVVIDSVDGFGLSVRPDTRLSGETGTGIGGNAVRKHDQLILPPKNFGPRSHLRRKADA